MRPTELYKSGFTDLVSVVPPGARISERSALKDKTRGKIPGVRRHDGTWSGYNWLKQSATAEDVAQWEEWGANVGLLAARYPGLDIDCDNLKLTTFIRREAENFIGKAPIRTSTGERALLVYRTDKPFERLKAEIVFNDETHVVEVLSAGRQYVISGTHPSGAQYGWDGPSLQDWAASELNELSLDKALAFLEHLQTRLAGHAEVNISNIGTVPKAEAPDQSTLRAPSLEELEILVAQIPNIYSDRETYIAVGCAVKAAGGEGAFHVFADWASRWEGGTNQEEVVKSDWKRMHPPFRIGWAWLRDLAEGHGYNTAPDEFEVVYDASELQDGAASITGVLLLSDTWVVEQLTSMLHEQIRYVPESGNWHVWNGSAWEQDRLNRAEHLVRQGLVGLSQLVQDMGTGVASKKEADKFGKAIMALQSRNALTKALPELQAHPVLTLCQADFDADDWALNTPEGLVDLKTGERTGPNPAKLCSKSVAVPPAKATPNLWLEFLADVTGGDEELQLYLQKLAGYALTGTTQEQILAFIHGPPLTGKTVFLETLSGIFGSYHVTTDANTFSAPKGDRHPADIAALAGARLVTAAETAEGRSWDTQRVKTLTGGDEVSARHMRQNFFTYKPRYQIIIVGNHEPEVGGVDDALMRRLHIIPFEHSPENPDRLLFERLKDEWPAILQWAIDGCKMWLEEGLTPPPAVVERTKSYRREEDPIGLFLEECCIIDAEGDATVSRRQLFEVWAQWCHAQGEDPGTLKQLKRRIRAYRIKHGWQECRVIYKGRSSNGYRGLAINQAENEFNTEGL